MFFGLQANKSLPPPGVGHRAFALAFSFLLDSGTGCSSKQFFHVEATIAYLLTTETFYQRILRVSAP